MRFQDVRHNKRVLQQLLILHRPTDELNAAWRSFHGVTISEEGYESTAKVLTELMGFEPAGTDGNRFRYRASWIVNRGSHGGVSV